MENGFSFVTEKEYYVLNLNFLELSHLNSKKFNNEWKSKADHHWLVNCDKLDKLPPDWVREFLQAQIALKKNEKNLRLINVGVKLTNFLKQEGLSDSLKTSLGIKDALQEWGIMTKKTLDTNLINPFLEATVKVLEIQAQVTSVAQKIRLKKTGEPMSGDVSGVIGLVSQSFNGNVIVSFPEQTFLKIMSNMLGEQFTKLDQDLIDGAGELLNMIFGQAKVKLNEKGYGIKMAIPSVVAGKNHSLSSLNKSDCVLVPFESTAGMFFVEIGFN